jgi:hypothetical protein
LKNEFYDGIAPRGFTQNRGFIGRVNNKVNDAIDSWDTKDLFRPIYNRDSELKFWQSEGPRESPDGIPILYTYKHYTKTYLGKLTTCTYQVPTNIREAFDWALLEKELLELILYLKALVIYQLEVLATKKALLEQLSPYNREPDSTKWDWNRWEQREDPRPQPYGESVAVDWNKQTELTAEVYIQDCVSIKKSITLTCAYLQLYQRHLNVFIRRRQGLHLGLHYAFASLNGDLDLIEIIESYLGPPVEHPCHFRGQNILVREKPKRKEANSPRIEKKKAPTRPTINASYLRERDRLISPSICSEKANPYWSVPDLAEATPAGIPNPNYRVSNRNEKAYHLVDGWVYEGCELNTLSYEVNLGHLSQRNYRQPWSDYTFFQSHIDADFLDDQDHAYERSVKPRPSAWIRWKVLKAELVPREEEKVVNPIEEEGTDDDDL